ncbi:MAG: chemotaxis protein CheW [Ramlibacter sp.]|nr:chemotaxis protein CheW [Ramlibacter sp.]
MPATPAIVHPPTPAALLAPTVALLTGFVLDEPAQALAPSLRAAPAANDAASTLLREGFRIGSLRLAIRYEEGNELTDMPPVYPLPRAPSWFRGMANLHGTLVPVFDTAALFGAVHAPDAKPMLLVLGHGEEKAGLVIDGLPVRLRLATADRIDDPAAPAALAGCVDHAYWSEGEDWMELRAAALLDRLAGELAGSAA